MTSITLLFDLFIWITSLSVVEIVAPALFVMVRVRPPVLSRMARSPPVCSIVPLFVIVELPVTEIATPLEALTTSELPASTVPVWPVVSVCTVFDVCPSVMVERCRRGVPVPPSPRPAAPRTGPERPER
ncbi:MAG: hypothetical protein WDN30_10890 [Pararobbsia sp.]